MEESGVEKVVESEGQMPLSNYLWSVSGGPKKCFICNEAQLSPELTKRSLSNHGVPATKEEKSNILRILCQLLHVKWDMISEIFEGTPCFPFCATCVSMVLQLIGLREKLVQLEAEMLDKIKAVAVTIAETELFGDLQQECRTIFRKQALKEYNSKQRLREKISELKAEHDGKADHIIEIEPSFVQLHLGMSMFDRQVPLTPVAANQYRSKSSQKMSQNQFLEEGRGPLTRLRLSAVIPKVKDEPIEPLPPDDGNIPGDLDDFSEIESKAEIEREERDSEVRGGRESDYQEEDEAEYDSDFEVSRPRTRYGKRRKSVRKSKPVPLVPKARKGPVEEFTEITIGDDGRRFFEGVEIHWRVGEPGRGSFILKCGKCPKEIDQKLAKSHQRCPYRLMQVHIKAHLGAYKCSQCGKHLSDNRQLRKHVERKHPPGGRKRKARVFGSEKFPPEVVVGENGRVEYQNIEIIRNDRGEDDYDVECSACGKILNKRTARKNKQCPYRQMVNHIKGAHIGAFSCVGCGKSYHNSKSLRKHMVAKHSDHPPDWRCDVCGKPMQSQRYMRKHKWSHRSAEERATAIAAGEKEPPTYADIMEKRRALGGPAFQCSECGKTFHFMANLKRHEHVHQKDIRNHQCTQCGKFYCTAESLNSHIKYIHESERVHKKYRCRFCEKWFVTKSPWMKHERTHTKDIPYFCPMCNKGFALKQSLTNHVRNNKCILGRGPLNPRPRKPPTKSRRQECPESPAHAESEESGGGDISPPLSQEQSFYAVPSAVLPLPRREAHQTGIGNIPGITTAIANFPFTTYPRPFDQNYLHQHYDNYM